MAKSPSEQVRELNIQVEILRERDAARTRELAILCDDTRELEAELTGERDARQRLEIDVTALRQQLQEHVKRAELWDSRRWGLIVLLAGAVPSLASGLIVALARK